MRCITNYIRLTVSLITLILSFFIFGGVNLAYESLQNIAYTTNENSYEQVNIAYEEAYVINQDEKIEKLLSTNENLKESWQIEIPIIDLVAPIDEGTTQEVMKNYVGHFENTSLWKGNIGLAAHNRRLPYKLF